VDGVQAPCERAFRHVTNGSGSIDPTTSSTGGRQIPGLTIVPDYNDTSGDFHRPRSDGGVDIVGVIPLKIHVSSLFDISGSLTNRQNEVVPLPGRTDLRKNLEDLLNTGDCRNFVSNLLKKTGELYDNPPFSTDALKLFDSAKEFKLMKVYTTSYGLKVGGTVSGNISYGTAVVHITEKTGNPESRRTKYIYTEAALHELLHHGGRNGYYEDAQLANAILKLGGLKKEDKEVLKSKNISENPGATEFLDYMLQEHCPGKKIDGVIKSL
jgi:hypothetical protein